MNWGGPLLGESPRGLENARPAALALRGWQRLHERQEKVQIQQPRARVSASLELETYLRRNTALELV